MGQTPLPDLVPGPVGMSAPTAYEQICIGKTGYLYQPIGETIYDNYPSDVRLLEEGACSILDSLARHSKPNLIARLVPTLDKEHAATPAFFRRFGAVLWRLNSNQLRTFTIVDEGEFKATVNDRSPSSKEAILSCFAPHDLVEGARVDCEISEPQLGGFPKALGIVSWTIPSSKPIPSLQTTINKRDERRPRKDLHPGDLLRLGSDKIEIAWRLGRSWMSISSPYDSAESFVESFKQDVESEKFLREMKDFCPSLPPDEVKKAWRQYGLDISPMADHVTLMKGAMDDDYIDIMIKALFGTIDLKHQSLEAVNAPREVIDAFRLGVLSASFELYAIKTCAQQTLQKSLAAPCSRFIQNVKIQIVQNDSDWASSMEDLLSKYGVPFKLPSVDCSSGSQQAFLRYVEQVKRSSWSALRSKLGQRGDIK